LGHEYVHVVSKLAVGKIVLVLLILLMIVIFLWLRIYHYLKNKKTQVSGWSYARGDGRNNQE
jgi:uncharacterized membrane protein YqiK